MKIKECFILTNESQDSLSESIKSLINHNGFQPFGSVSSIYNIEDKRARYSIAMVKYEEQKDDLGDYINSAL